MTRTAAPKATKLNLELLVEPPGGSALVEDYVSGDGRARDFYEGAPADPETYRDKAREVDGRFDRDARRRAVEMVSAPLEETRRKLEELVDRGGYFVTTGQQPGLFTGPLYTIYKALSAVGRARALEELLERPVVPLFWTASEDHDWEEVRRTWVVDTDNDLREIVLPHHGMEGEPALHRIPVETGLEEARRELERHLPETDFIGPYRELLQSAYTGGATLPEAFDAVLEELLGSHGLCFVDADAPGLKEASLPVLLEALERSPEHEDLLRERADALAASGYHVQVPILEGGVNLFLEGPAGRERLYRSGGGFQLRQSGREVSASEIRSRAGDDPRALSPNALLRPVVESAVLPTLSYVAGPGEMAYLAQVGPLFRAHGLGMPVVAPRCSITVLEGKNEKVLEKFGLDMSELDRPFHELASRVARDEVPADVRRALGRFRGALGEHAGELRDAATGIDPTLKGSVESARNAALQALDEVEKKIVQAVKRQDEIALSQLEKAQVHLFPAGKPQERVLNVFYYLARYGDAFLEGVAEACLVDLEGEGS